VSWVQFKFARTWRGIITIIAVVILLLYFVRPGVDSLRSRIAGSISGALSRRVEISSVSFRFLPQPGFDLENFVVYDNPAFSAEPILRAQEVTAALRVTSLFRGRLEISRLSLTEPSLNLVRTAEGRWNLGNFVERASKIPIAPTSKAKSEPRAGFPYIEASNGRINFKLGQEKKAFALTDADFSVWQNSENAWSMRLKARPVRTDSNLSDTGILRAEGSWQRSVTLGETPLLFNLQWEGAQLGQFTKLATGADRGWRGVILWSAQLSGTPANLNVQSSASIDDFRRYDIAGSDVLHLAAQCSGHYDSTALQLSGLDCRAPVGAGTLKVSGNVGNLGPTRNFDLVFTGRDIPIPSVVALLHHAKKYIADDLVSSGKLDADFTLNSGQNGQAIWQGSGAVQNGRLLSALNNTDLIFDRIPFAVSPGKMNVSSDPGPHLDLGPTRVSVGAPTPVTIRASISRASYGLQLQGDTRIRRLLQAARTLGLPFSQPAADGSAKVELQIAGIWSGFQPAIITGKAQLSGVRAEIAGVNSPLEIATANITLRPDEATADNVTATLGPSTWHGSLTRPRHCVDPSACTVHFDFQTKELTAVQAAQLFVSEQAQPWYRFLSSPQTGNSFLANLNAEGTLKVNQMLIRQFTATQVSAKVTWKGRRLQLTDLRGDFLGGTHTGEWDADFSTDSPQYTGQGSLQHAALGQLAQTMHDEWVKGTASASYQVNASGGTADEFLASVHGTLQVEAHEASLPHMTLTASGSPFFARHFAGKIIFRNGRLEIREGKLETASGIYQVNGTALKGRGLNLQMLKDTTHGFNITGTLATPRVTIVRSPETQTALKSQ
jgi:hypothetical protein